MRAFSLIIITLAIAKASAADLVYSVEGMETVTTRSNVFFKSVNDWDLRADFYLPLAQSNSPMPAVIFVLGDASPEQLRNAKDWTFLQSYGRLVAASGFAGVTFNHRSSENFRRLAEVRSDIQDAVAFVRKEGKAFGIDPKRLCLWYFSGSGMHLGVGMGTNALVTRCIVAYYPLLAPPDRENLEAFSALAEMQRDAPAVPPSLLVKAGRDAPGLNRLIDEFRKEAERLDLPLEYLEHPTGPHAFDIRDDSEVSREIIKKTIAFIRRHCAEAGSQAPTERGDAK
jgi:dienelactone hydrolase